MADPTDDPAVSREEHAAALSTLASGKRAELAGALERIGEPEGWRWLRAPEIGLVMVRGRAGGGGAPFNLGEATVTRAALVLGDGTEGHAYALGRDKRAARDAALLDALWCGEDRDAVEREALAPIRRRRAEQDARAGAESAATRVEFSTMMRGDD